MALSPPGREGPGPHQVGGAYTQHIDENRQCLLSVQILHSAKNDRHGFKDKYNFLELARQALTWFLQTLAPPLF